MYNEHFPLAATLYVPLGPSWVRGVILVNIHTPFCHLKDTKTTHHLFVFVRMTTDFNIVKVILRRSLYFTSVPAFASTGFFVIPATD